VSSEGSKVMGVYKNWPERHCCGCARAPDTSCNTNTGKGCKMFSCGLSLGPTTCVNSSTCMCQPGHCAGSSGVCSLYQPNTAVTTLAALASPTGQSAAAAGGGQTAAGTCVDTLDWSNLWSGCAWQPEGKNESLCRPTPGASWPSTAGWTCEYYRAKGLCKNGEITFASGEIHNFPEMNCCGCAKPVATSCNIRTGGTCSMGGCDSSRGPTVCVNGTCLCKAGHCGTSSGYCSLQVEGNATDDLLVMYGRSPPSGSTGNLRASSSTVAFLGGGCMLLVVLGFVLVYHRSTRDSSSQHETEIFLEVEWQHE